MESVFNLLAWLFVELLLVGTGRAVVRLLTLGRWRGEQFAGDESRIYGPAGALSFRRDGQRVITKSGLFAAGLLFCLVTVTTLFGLL
ncbi:hypothetical protein PEC18_13840 [Paucibacter sp. O1-1]|nr:hypothetical protein [Paucibacter sp. O1-1]MDA3826899.1 hypothetical protein [Paucibacter sp. O1-1]